MEELGCAMRTLRENRCIFIQIDNGQINAVSRISSWDHTTRSHVSTLELETGYCHDKGNYLFIKTTRVGLGRWKHKDD